MKMPETREEKCKGFPALQRRLVSVAVALMVLNGIVAEREARGVVVSGFTGPEVPALASMKGDYNARGAFDPATWRTNIPLLISKLQEIHATDYFHTVWTEEYYPGGWEDFQLMAPQFQAAGIRLWLYLTPPSEGVPDPYGGDYVRWATECATISAQYPTVSGLIIDDFSFDTGTFTAGYCQSMMDAAHLIDPKLSLLATVYYHGRLNILPHLQAGAIDGVVFPYCYAEAGNKYFSNTEQLRPQIEELRALLDQHTTYGGFESQMPLVTMVYAMGLSFSADYPTPEYVETCLNIGLQATADGLASGVATYCLPKDQQAYMDVAARAYAVPEPTGPTFWTGSVNNQWNNNSNWTADPTGAGVQINSGSNMPVLLNTADSATYLYLGMNTGDSGSMTIANGANLNTGYGLFVVGIGGVGTVTQTGGTVSAGGMDLADGAAGIGTYTISGGAFNAIGGSYIGARGTGTLNIEGGEVIIASWSPGGKLTVGGVGASDGGIGLTSTINQTGGTLYATGQLEYMMLGVREGSIAIYNLDGGTFKLGTNIVNGAGIGYLKINGGTLQFQNGVDSGNSIDVDYLEIGTKDGVTAGYTQDWYYDKSIKAGTLTLGSDTSTGTLGILGGTVTVGDLIFGGTTSRVTLDDLLSISVLQSNYTVADGLADVAAGYVGVIGGAGVVDVGTVDIGGVNYTQITAIINPIPGDATLDGKVDADDAAMLAENWLSSNGVGWKQGDFNDDGKVDDIDAAVLAANWWRTREQQASVPEPAMPLLIVGGLLALFAWRKRHND